MVTYEEVKATVRFDESLKKKTLLTIFYQEAQVYICVLGKKKSPAVPLGKMNFSRTQEQRTHLYRDGLKSRQDF